MGPIYTDLGHISWTFTLDIPQHLTSNIFFYVLGKWALSGEVSGDPVRYQELSPPDVSPPDVSPPDDSPLGAFTSIGAFSSIGFLL